MGSIDGRDTPYVTPTERMQRKTQDFICLVIAAGSLSCASPDTQPRFQLTMIGIHVEDPERTLRFYEEKLGMHIFLRRAGGAMVSPGGRCPPSIKAAG